MYERFTTEARDVVVRAFDMARYHRHAHIGADHVLASLARGSDSTAAVLTEHGLSASALDRFVGNNESGPVTGPLTQQDAVALRSLGIDVGRIRSSVEKTFGRGALDGTPPAAPARRRWRGRRARRGARGSTSVHLPFTDGVRKSLDLSVREATDRRDTSISTVHIALGVLRSGDKTVTQVLSDLGVDSDALRRDVEVAPHPS